MRSGMLRRCKLGCIVVCCEWEGMAQDYKFACVWTVVGSVCPQYTVAACDISLVLQKKKNQKNKETYQKKNKNNTQQQQSKRNK